MDIKSLVGREDPIILEIGANSGQDTVNYYNMFQNPDVYCFEPGKHAADLFRQRNLKAKLFEVALSDTNGTVVYHSSDNDELSGSIIQPKLHLTVHTHVHFNNNYTVKTMRLDDFVKEHNIGEISFVWQDVQGAEEKVIKGGLDTFLNKVHYLFTEFSKIELYKGNLNQFQILDLLPGYEIVEVTREWMADGDVLLKNTRFS